MIIDPRSEVPAFASHRDVVLEAVQTLIREGHARIVDGERFKTDLPEKAVLKRLWSARPRFRDRVKHDIS